MVIAVFPGLAWLENLGYLGHRFSSIDKRRPPPPLGERALLPEHVGSTSVHGLAAKPVIDILLAVQTRRMKLPMFRPWRRRDSYCGYGNLIGTKNRLLKTPYAEGSLHVFSMGCEEIDRMLDISRPTADA